MATAHAAALAVFFDLGDTLLTIHPPEWIPGAQELLAALRESGVRLGVISNTRGRDRAGLGKYLPAGFSWDTFDPKLIVLSGEVGVDKPNPAIFKLALERAGGALAVFCTENLTHSLASQRAGLPCLRAVPPPNSDVAQVLAVLRAVGLIGNAASS